MDRRAQVDPHRRLISSDQKKNQGPTAGLAASKNRDTFSRSRHPERMKRNCKGDASEVHDMTSCELVLCHQITTSSSGCWLFVCALEATDKALNGGKWRSIRHGCALQLTRHEERAVKGCISTVDRDIFNTVSQKSPGSGTPPPSAASDARLWFRTAQISISHSIQSPLFPCLLPKSHCIPVS